MTDDAESPSTRNTMDRPRTRAEMAQAVAADIPTGSYVNLGIGLPTSVSAHLTASRGVVLHTENGMLGMGPEVTGDDVDEDLTNAGKVPVSELLGASYFDQAASFAMMRGGHIDLCVLGAFQISARGDLANWHTGAPESIPAVGGAMDLAVGAKRVWVMMLLFAKDGSPKLVPQCTFPLTGAECVDRVYTDYGTFEVGTGGVRILDTFAVTESELLARLDVDVLRRS